MSGLATAARTITWECKPRRAKLTACAPGVDAASPTLLFPAKQALGDRLVAKAPDGQWSWAALCSLRGKGGLLPRLGAGAHQVSTATSDFSCCLHFRAALWMRTNACGVRV